MKNTRLDITSSTLSGIEILSGLDADERDEIANLCHRKIYEADEQILSHQDKSTGVFFVISGSVRVAISSSSGKEITFRDLSAGNIFGELSAIDDNPRSAHVIALLPSSLVFMTAEDFWRVLETYPDVRRRTFKYMAGLIRSLTERIVEFRALDVRNRIRAELLRLGREVTSGESLMVIEPAPTHNELANRVSTHREAVTREIGFLTRQGILCKKGSILVIQNVDKLQQMICDNTT